VKLNSDQCWYYSSHQEEDVGLFAGALLQAKSTFRHQQEPWTSTLWQLSEDD